ncbi:unnamed protein product [Vitrella brassicaformis CCMP3155]|uniref:Uncharacterized protein n=1 Tax=Vitrella brassicaformis (strain CCMP3155) TaxID=1169540 RepID=A0A0G4F161_VITBC|nr:unnamed protein product [Vitrella brassicaformis CCMP3155]|eukprot:CEM05438.1 unnamed protein product [Vitrella brassicaformis CCMP3155]
MFASEAAFTFDDHEIVLVTTDAGHVQPRGPTVRQLPVEPQQAAPLPFMQRLMGIVLYGCGATCTCRSGGADSPIFLSSPAQTPRTPRGPKEAFTNRASFEAYEAKLIQCLLEDKQVAKAFKRAPPTACPGPAVISADTQASPRSLLGGPPEVVANRFLSGIQLVNVVAVLETSWGDVTSPSLFKVTLTAVEVILHPCHLDLSGVIDSIKGEGESKVDDKTTANGGAKSGGANFRVPPLDLKTSNANQPEECGRKTLGTLRVPQVCLTRCLFDFGPIKSLNYHLDLTGTSADEGLPSSEDGGSAPPLRSHPFCLTFEATLPAHEGLLLYEDMAAISVLSHSIPPDDQAAMNKSASGRQKKNKPGGSKHGEGLCDPQHLPIFRACRLSPSPSRAGPLEGAAEGRQTTNACNGGGRQDGDATVKLKLWMKSGAQLKASVILFKLLRRLQLLGEGEGEGGSEQQGG